MVQKRIGFACKWVDSSNTPDPLVNMRSTTVAWLKRQQRDVAVQRLWDIVQHNISSVGRFVEKIAQQNPQLRMARIGSHVLPMYTEPSWRWFYEQSDIRDYCAKHFAPIGEFARAHDVRLSFHPGQFCVLASSDNSIVERSIEEFEYHVDVARWMGYGTSWHDHGFKINIHLSGRGGAAKYLSSLSRMTPEAQNLITIENDEMSAGLDDILAIGSHTALVLDIHHHWIRTGEYILPTDRRVQQVLDSWRGTRPTAHFSVSREDLLIDHCSQTRPDMPSLLAAGYRKQKLRAHSDFYWNTAVNEWALGFTQDFDIMCESKAKNLASFAFYELAKQKKIFN